MKIDKTRAISALIQRQAIDIERAKEYIGKANSDIDELRTGLEQQAQEIAKLKEINGKQRVHIRRRCDECPNRMDSFKQHVDLTDKVFELGQEIAKKDRMIELAVRQLSKSKKCAMWITSECFHKEKPLRAKCPDDGCWLTWLEKEAEVPG